MRNEILNIKQVAEYLNVSIWQVRKYVREGSLPRIYESNKGNAPLIFFESDLVKFLKSNNQEG